MAGKVLMALEQMSPSLFEAACNHAVGSGGDGDGEGKALDRVHAFITELVPDPGADERAASERESVRLLPLTPPRRSPDRVVFLLCLQLLLERLRLLALLLSLFLPYYCWLLATTSYSYYGSDYFGAYASYSSFSSYYNYDNDYNYYPCLAGCPGTFPDHHPRLDVP